MHPELGGKRLALLKDIVPKASRVAVLRSLRRILDLAAKSRLPALYWSREPVEAGGLVSYGASIPDMYRQAAVFVDKIPKGAKPAVLPIEQPSKFELAINLKTAKALGVTVPPSLLLQADKVID